MAEAGRTGAAAGRRAWMGGWLGFFGLSLLFGAGVFCAIRDIRPVVRDRGDHVNLPDGAYYMILAREFWFGERRDLYRPDTQMAVLSDQFGRPIERSMPANVLPAAFLVMLPFATIRNLDLAYCAWIGGSLASLACALALLWRAAGRGAPLAWAGLAVTLVSCAMGESILGAQTTILHLACLVFLLAHARGPRPADVASTSLAAGALFALAMKPQYLALGIGLLLIERRWREVVFGAVLILAITHLIGSRMGEHWLQDYVATLRLYRGQGIGEVYRGAFAPAEMNIFAKAFSCALGERAAAAVSWMAMAAGVGLSVIWGASRPRAPGAPAPPDSARAAHQTMMAAYLLFSPHSGPYEELMTAFLVAAAIAAPPGHPVPRRALLAHSLGLAMVVNRPALPMLPLHPIGWWLLKALVLTSFVWTRPWSSKFTGAESPAP